MPGAMRTASIGDTEIKEFVPPTPDESDTAKALEAPQRSLETQNRLNQASAVAGKQLSFIVGALNLSSSAPSSKGALAAPVAGTAANRQKNGISNPTLAAPVEGTIAVHRAKKEENISISTLAVAEGVRRQRQ